MCSKRVNLSLVVKIIVVLIEFSVSKCKLIELKKLRLKFDDNAVRKSVINELKLLCSQASCSFMTFTVILAISFQHRTFD